MKESEAEKGKKFSTFLPGGKEFFERK